MTVSPFPQEISGVTCGDGECSPYCQACAGL